MESGGEDVRRRAIDLVRSADLVDTALVKNSDAVPQAHRLGLIVGDVDSGGAEAALKLFSSSRAELRNLASRFDRGSSRRKVSAWPTNGSGMLRPRAFAVLRLNCQIEPARSLNWNIFNFCALDNSIDIISSAVEHGR
jgi:hypothetical protein